jgi:exopolysaccharide production protein ExoY
VSGDKRTMIGNHSQAAFGSSTLLTESVLAPSAGRRFAQLLKRVLDILGAALLVVLAAPLMLVIAAIVAIDGGPVCYRHRRVGLAGRQFGCLKFRTMILGAQECLEEYLYYHPAAQREWADKAKLDRDPRITAVGRFLRRSSLDELPQLLNVIRGDMSLVGPRPITTEELSHYENAAALYFAVRPGITGLWQISGRNEIGYAQRVALDVHYIRSWSLTLDVSILLRTPRAVLSHRGAQ